MTDTAVPDATTDDVEGQPVPPESGFGSDRRLTAFALVSVVAVIVLTMGSSLIGLRTLTVTDLLNADEPWRSLVSQDWSFPGTWFGDHVNVMLPNTAEFVDRLWDGDFALWSPYNNGGTPLGAVGEVSLLSPTTWPYLVLPLWLAPAWSHLVVMVIAIGGMVLFLRRLGVSTMAGVVAGLAFATSGFMYVWMNWPQTRTAAFLPWMFWAVERAIQERRPSSVVPVALVTTLTYVGFFPVVAIYVFGAGVLYAGFRLLFVSGEGTGRDLGRTAGLIVGAVALGLGLLAWTILPLTDYLGGVDLAYRAQSTECHAPTGSLGSLIFPRYGSAADFDFACPIGEHETDVFAGAMVLGLAVLGLIAPKRRLRGQRAFFAALAAVTCMLVYVGGPALWLVQQFPIFEDNRIMRIRVLMSFALAVLAAFGFDRLRAEARSPERRRLLIGLASLMGAAAVLAWTIHDWPDIPSPPLGGWIPVLACLAAGAVFLAIRAPSTALRVGAVALVPLLVGAEAVAAIRPYWPTGDPDDLYSETSTTDFLDDRLGDDRIASTYNTLTPNANRVYGLRALTGRSFYEDTWGDLILAVNGRQVGLRSLSVIPILPIERVQSPVLDRLGVRYYVADSGFPIYGEAREFGEPGGRAELRPGRPVVVPLDGPVRAIGLDLPVTPDTGGERPRVEVELLDADGDVVATGSQRIFQWIEDGPWHIPVAGDGAVSTVAARLTLVDAQRPLVVNEYDGRPVAYVVLPEEDGLRLVHADATAIYERTSALPRIRWAAEAIVEPDADRRVELLADPTVPASTVVLSDQGPEASGERADVDVVDDAGDDITATIDAAGDGYLVVADALQRGWRAELDGESTELRAADHGVVAVAVPEGTHEVRLYYAPPGQRTGIWIAAVSALVLGGLALTAVRRRSVGQAMRSPNGDGASP